MSRCQTGIPGRLYAGQAKTLGLPPDLASLGPMGLQVHKGVSGLLNPLHFLRTVSTMSAHPTHELESARPQSTALTIDDKGEFDHVEVDDIETKKPAAFVVDNYGELSKQHDLSFRATLVQFKRAMVICFGVGICAMGDGYQYKMPGNIVALPGFIRQMGYQNAEGKWMLDPQHVAAWGGKSEVFCWSLLSGVYAASVVCILLVGSYPIDRFGRKPMLIATQVFMLIACLIEMWATNWTHWIAAKVLNVCHTSGSADERVFRLDVIR